MKKNLLAFLMLFLTPGIFSASAQTVDTANIPAVVKNNFYEKHTDAQKVEWKMSDQNYLVKFEIADIDHKIIYSPAGEIISSAREIKAEELPAAVTAAIAKDFSNYKIEEADEITTSGVITYKVELDGEPDVKAWYKADGTLIKKSSDR